MSELSPGIFNGLTSLWELVLYGNSISKPPPGIFDQLTSLVELLQHCNCISELQLGSFTAFTGLTIRTCSRFRSTNSAWFRAGYSATRVEMMWRCSLVVSVCLSIHI